MEKSRKQEILLGILVVIAFFVWGRVFDTPKVKPQQLKDEKSFVVTMDEDAMVFFSGVQNRRERKSSYARWGRNPFVKYVAKVSKKSKLEGILWETENPKAVVDGNIVGVGDKIDGAIIVEIRQDRLILNNGAKDFEEKLW